MTKNQKLFYVISFLSTLVFTTSTWTFFLMSIRNFSFWQSLFLITCTWIASLLFEIPSWIWADRFGRKKLFILWIILNIIDLLIWIFTWNFIFFVISWFINWIWNAMISWNLEALIHDELEEKKKENKFNEIISNSYSLLFFWRVVAVLSSWFLYVINPFFPLYFTLFPLILIFILWFFINEPNQILSSHKDNLNHFKETFNLLLKNKIILYFIIILSLISGIWNIYFFTEQLYLKDIWFKIENIWIIFALWAFVSSIWAYLYKKFIAKLHEKIIVNMMLVLLLVSSILFIFFDKVFAITWIIITSLIFWMIMSFGNNYLISKVPKYQKSTILSVFSFWITLWYTLFNLIISFIVDKIWLWKVYFLSIIFIIILILFNLFTFNRQWK